jgi:hypothetical protein
MLLGRRGLHSFNHSTRTGASFIYHHSLKGLSTHITGIYVNAFEGLRPRQRILRGSLSTDIQAQGFSINFLWFSALAQRRSVFVLPCSSPSKLKALAAPRDLVHLKSTGSLACKFLIILSAIGHIFSATYYVMGSALYWLARCIASFRDC